MDGSDWLSLGSLIVAAAALGWTIARDRHGLNALDAERHDRRDSQAREEGRREEELRLLRLQVERQVAADTGKQTADLIGKSTGYSGDSNGVTFPMSVRNVGASVARDVRVWLAFQSPDPNDPPGAAATGTHDLGALAPNDAPAKFSLQQAGASAGGGVPRDGLIVARWTDGTGERTETIGKLTIFV